MRRTFSALAAAVAVLSSCGGGSNNPADDTTADAECVAALDEAFQAWAAAGFSGSIAVSTGGTFDCLGAYGIADEATGAPNTIDTVFSIGSVSKAFTAAAVLDLVDAGTLDLTDRAGAVVTDLAGPAADATVEQLLLHTSGLVGSHGQDHAPLDRAGAVAAISRLERAFEPGTDFLYSNAGYTLLAIIVEEASGVGYRDHVTDEILPLPDGTVAGGFWDGEPAAPGPRAVGYLDGGPTEEMGDFDGPHWALAGNGDLAMTARALATWTQSLFTGRIVSPGATALISDLAFEQDAGISEQPGWVAYDESLFGEPFLASAGGGGDVGHNAAVMWVPGSQRVITIMSNTPGITAEELLRAVGPALATGDPPPTPDPPAPDAGADVDPAELAAVAGTYELEPAATFEVTADGDRLAIAADGADAIAAVFPLPSDVTAADVAAHEDAVAALLAGETQAGRDERDLLEASFGAIGDVEVVATIVDGGELRTYVSVTSGTERIRLWYALDEQGGIAAAEGPTDPPTRAFVPSGDGTYRPDDPTGSGTDVVVTFEAGQMSVTGPVGTIVAELAS